MTGCDGRASRASRAAAFWHASKPFSADPLEADEIVNSIAFGPVQATLVDRGRKGSFIGGLAESWNSSSDFKEWRFRFRPGATYETGEAVEPRHLVACWLRLRDLIHKNGSRHPLLEKLSAADGLTADDSVVTLRFKVSVPNLLSQVSDELLALAHPSCYEHATGAWRCGRAPIASGPYRVVSWDDSGVRLGLREDFPAALRHPAAFKTIEIVSEPGIRDSADLIYGFSRDDKMPEHLRFHGSMDSAIAYLRCQSWSLPGSPCHQRASREALRDAYYRELDASGFIRARTFFPTSIRGIEPLALPKPRRPGILGPVAVRPITGKRSFLAPSNRALEAAIRSLGGSPVERETSSEQRYKELAPGLPHYDNDIALFLTEITLDDPNDSVRFMFTSKEGARLPDPTGRIQSRLDDPVIDLQAVSRILWEDAVVWPVAHTGFGVWTTDRIDMSLANTGSVITPLRWIGAAR